MGVNLKWVAGLLIVGALMTSALECFQKTRSQGNAKCCNTGPRTENVKSKTEIKVGEM